MFGRQDSQDTCKVAVVSEPASAALFENDAVGRVMYDAAGQPIEIVGVVTPRALSSATTSSEEPAIYYYPAQGELPSSRGAAAEFRIPVLGTVGSAILDLQIVSSDYFNVVGLSPRAGELFTETASTRFCRVGVINERAAQMYFGGNAVGGAVIDGRGVRTTIVGVVPDVRLRSTERAAEPSIYVPMAQDSLPRMHMLLDSADASVELQQTIHRRLRAVEGGNPEAISVITLDERLRRTALAAERIAVLLLAAAAVNALILGVFGLQRIIADDVLVRRREIAVRSALGAQRWRLIIMVVIQAVRIAGVGGLFGILGALPLVRWVRSVTGFEGGPIGWIWLAGPPSC